MLRSAMLGLALVSLAGAATAAPPPLAIEGAQIRASLGNSPTTAGYLTIRSTGVGDRLVGASCDCARSVTLHQTVRADGVAKMVEEKGGVHIPAGGHIAFAPGGRHLMLMGLKAPLKAGDKATIVLRFQNAGPVRAVFTVTDTPGAAAGGGHHH